MPLDMQMICSIVELQTMNTEYPLPAKRHRQGCRGFATAGVLALWAVCWPAHGTTGGSIAGLVQDASGGVISSVTVVARNRTTGVEQKTATNGAGFYGFPTLPSGQYELRVDHAGFSPFLQAGVEVTSDAALRIDIQLVVGTKNEMITVAELSTQVETASTQMGHLISGSKLTNIPVNGRSYTDLLALQPGVTPVSSKQPNAVVMSGCASAPPSGDLNPGDMSVSGQRETSNGFVVNGSTVQEAFNMFAAVVPNLDSIQEFRVLTSNFDAEYGNFSGGQVVVTTKGGGNELHGSVFEFARNTNLAGRNFFAPTRAKYDRNQFGGTLGGPIRRERTFFFADYQGTRLTRGVDTGLIPVPSAGNRAGDFSDIADTPFGNSPQVAPARSGEGLQSGASSAMSGSFPGCAWVFASRYR